MIILSGDIHGTLDIDKLIHFFSGKESQFTKDDYLIICGDVGVCGFSPITSQQTRAILESFPVTTLFIDGNHEQFEDLNSYDISLWHGGKVHMISDSIIHLMRGEIFDIDGRSVLALGGAFSTDRAYRTLGIDWFEEEMPSHDEIENAWKNLSDHDMQVDLIVTHCAPYEVMAALDMDSYDEELELTRELQRIADIVDFQDWYFGHYHMDEDIEDNFHCLYDEVVML